MTAWRRMGAEDRARWSLDGRTVVVFGSFCSYDWDFLRQRQQQIVERLARRARVFYVERHGARPLPPLKALHALVKRFRPGRRGTTVAAGREGIVFIRAPLLPWHGVRVIDRLNAVTLAAALRRILPVPLDECVALAFYPSPYVRSTIARVPFETVLYDAAQRYEEVPDVYGVKAGEIDRELATLADVTSCDSVTIAADRRRLGIDVWRMPQGCDAATAAPVRLSKIADSIAQEGGGRTIAGFVGALGDVLDWPLVLAAAALAPDVLWVFVGPDFGGTPVQLPANIAVHKRVEPTDVRSVLSAFDVGVIPYVLNRRTEAVLPTKLPEYLCAGLRVAATPLPDIVDWRATLGGGAIETAECADGLVRAVRCQAGRGRIDETITAALTRRLDWDGLVESWVDHIEQRRTERPPTVLVVGLNYSPTVTASDKNFARDVTLATLEAGRVRPVVLSVTATETVTMDQSRTSGSMPVYMTTRPFHRVMPAEKVAAEAITQHHRHNAILEYTERALACIRVRRWLRWGARRYNIKFVHFFDNMGPLMAWSSHSIGVRCGVTLVASTGSYRNPARRLLWRVSLRAMDDVVAGSQVLAERLPQPAAGRKVVIPWGPRRSADDKQTVPFEHRRLVVWTGPLQGAGARELDLSARAMAEPPTALPEMKAEVWPKPTFAREYRRIASRWGIETTVPGEDFTSRLREVRVLVSPIRGPETIVAPPLSWIEAIQVGAHVATTPCLGLPETYLDQGVVTVAADGSSGALRDAIVAAWRPAKTDGPFSVWTAEDAAEQYEALWVGDE